MFGEGNREIRGQLEGRDARLRGRGRVLALGFSWWKRRFVREFFAGDDVAFGRGLEDWEEGMDVVVWGCGMDARLEEWQRRGGVRGGVRVMRLEDGFLRSAGLGAGLARPLSWVVDPVGIYYDARRPSELERILCEGGISERILERADALVEQIVRLDLTKYNVGGGGWERPSGVEQVVLVVGQVEADASLAYGSPEVRSNMELLRRVREMRPAAWLVYKPHPDVVAGLRRQGQGEWGAQQWCDEVVEGMSVTALLCGVEEVHVMTSLAGFEGLLRGVRVVCHGAPFYSGWGLTDDLVRVERRGYRRTLRELVAAALILYPRYVSMRSGRRVEVEDALTELVDWRRHERVASSVVLNRWVRGMIHWILGWIYRCL